VAERSLAEDAWRPFRHHAEQDRLWSSAARFRVVAAGRRSGKTELAKRHLVARALEFSAQPDGWFTAGAPTRDQARMIFWEDLKAKIPEAFVRRVWESTLTIRLVNGVDVQVIGYDRPYRAEGRAMDGALLDEYADMRPEVWARSVRPALSTPGRPGWAWLFGKPRGRNHFWRLAQFASDPSNAGDWAYFHWSAEDILEQGEVEALRRELDPLSYDQEVRASFVTFAGRVYYAFEREAHAREALPYNPDGELILCFDFNVDPGVTVIAQEQRFREEPKARADRPEVADEITAVIGEVWIPHDSNTAAVCRKLIADWGAHRGPVVCRGDPAGGARSTKLEAGNDWTIIREVLSGAFGERLRLDVARRAPLQRVRVNAMNARLRAADGKVRCLVDPRRAPHVIDDLEGVVVKEGTDGEILKRPGSPLSHVSDALSYHVERAHPVGGARLQVSPL